MKKRGITDTRILIDSIGGEVIEYSGAQMAKYKKDMIKSLFERSYENLINQEWSDIYTLRIYCLGLMMKLDKDNIDFYSNQILGIEKYEDYPAVFSNDEIVELAMPYLEIKQTEKGECYVFYVKNEDYGSENRDKIIENLRSFGIQILEA